MEGAFDIAGMAGLVGEWPSGYGEVVSEPDLLFLCFRVTA